MARLPPYTVVTVSIRFGDGWTIEGVSLDESGHYRIPREAARRQFERALGRDGTSSQKGYLPRARGPRRRKG